MTEERFSEKTWTGPSLEAASISSNTCGGCGTITINLHAQDGARFAFGHIDDETAWAFLGDLCDLLEERARAGARQPPTGGH